MIVALVAIAGSLAGVVLGALLTGRNQVRTLDRQDQLQRELRLIGERQSAYVGVIEATRRFMAEASRAQSSMNHGQTADVVATLLPLLEDLDLAASVVSVIGSADVHHLALNLSATASRLSGTIAAGGSEVDAKATAVRHELQAWLSDFERQARHDLGVGDAPTFSLGLEAFQTNYAASLEERGVDQSDG